MVLLSSDPREPQCRQRLIDLLGYDDATALVTWLWENHRDGKAPSFPDALVAITMQTDQHGVQFARNLLDHARKPKHVREAEVEIMAFITPLIHESAETVRRLGGEEGAGKKEFDLLCYKLLEKLWKMYPHKHRATMRGAILAAFQHRGGAFTLNVAALVKNLELEDPLAATAAQSRLA